MVSQFKSAGWQVNPLIQEFSPTATRGNGKQKAPAGVRALKGLRSGFYGVLSAAALARVIAPALKIGCS